MSSNISLNLNTFELPENQDCPYVLTSPRSLQACRQLNLRPVDLLPKAESDIARGNPNLTSTQRLVLLQQIETRRLRQLEMARNLRDSIIAGSSRDIRRVEKQLNTSSLVNISEDSRDEDSSESSFKEDCKQKKKSSEETKENKESLMNKKEKDEQNESLQIWTDDGRGKPEKHEFESMENEHEKKSTSFLTNERLIHQIQIPQQSTQKVKNFRNSSYRIRPSSANKSQRASTAKMVEKQKIQNTSPYLCSQTVTYRPVSPFKTTVQQGTALSKTKVDTVSENRNKKFPAKQHYHWPSAALPRKSGIPRTRGSFALRPSIAITCRTDISKKEIKEKNCL
ncbi:UNVERIFIED_CONTAM: hypothetical protein RMT77_009853 [Armadillidium vulgare]